MPCIVLYDDKPVDINVNLKKIDGLKMMTNLCSFNFVKVDQSESPLTPMSGRLFFPNMATSKSLAYMHL